MRQAISFLFILIFTLSAFFAYGANSCDQLFDGSQFENESKKSHQKEIQERRSQTTWSVEDRRVNSHTILNLEFLPVNQRLVVDSQNQIVREVIVEVKGERKVRNEQIPLDQSLPGRVIDASLESGRRLLDSILGMKSENSNEVMATFIFIDVNNLGYVNNNFFNKSKDGDILVQGAAKLFLKMCADRGLLFRMGGDEFGIVLPPMSPAELKSFQNNLMKELRLEVHHLFKKETQVRSENLRAIKKSFELGQQGQIGQVDQATLEQEISSFKKYVTYSQEGLSIGAVYVGSGDAQSIQNSAENLATQMKIAVKSSLHQDVSKYTDQKFDFSGPPRTAYRYEFPLITQHDYKPHSGVIISEIDFQLPVVKSHRGKIIKRFGPISVVNYKGEDGQSETRIEYYQSQSDTTHKQVRGEQPSRLEKTEKADLHSHSGFLDAKSKEARNLLQFFMNRYDQPRGLIWINLLNLGKLNYFVHKTATGDRMIRRYAQIIESVLRDSDVPFKLQGSEFIILIDQVGDYKLQKIKNKLIETINSDAIVLQIYQEQIDYLQAQLENAKTDNQIANLALKISETLKLKNNAKVVVQAQAFNGPVLSSMDTIIQGLKK